MTETTADPNHVLAADLLVGVSANGFAGIFVDGFRAYARGDAEAAADAFGPAYAHLFVGEDITADLAAVYHVLAIQHRSRPTHRGNRAFTQGLCAAFERLIPADPVDQVALKLVLRLAAKIQCRDLLALMPRQLFNTGQQVTDELIELRENAFDTILGLASGNAEAGNYLRDIARTKAFPPDGVDELLFALCFAEPEYLIEHLLLLEDALVQIYGTSNAEPDPELLYRRILLLTDIGGGGYVRPTVLADVMDFALTHPSWRLAWIGRTLIDPLPSELDNDEKDNAEELLDSLVKGRSRPAKLPEGACISQQTTPTPADRRAAFNALRAEEVDVAEEQRFFIQIVGVLGGDDAIELSAAASPQGQQE